MPPAKCGDGEVMTKIDKQEYRMIITCSKLRTEGSCIHKETPQIDVSSSYINNANNLFNTMTECPTGYAMQFWKTQTFGDQATSINFGIHLLCRRFWLSKCHSLARTQHKSFRELGRSLLSAWSRRRGLFGLRATYDFWIYEWFPKWS